MLQFYVTLVAISWLPFTPVLYNVIGSCAIPAREINAYDDKPHERVDHLVHARVDCERLRLVDALGLTPSDKIRALSWATPIGWFASGY